MVNRDVDREARDSRVGVAAEDLEATRSCLHRPLGLCPVAQSMLLVKSEAAAKGFVSVNVATTRFANGAPTTGVIVCGEGRMLLGSSLTVALIGTGTRRPELT